MNRVTAQDVANAAGVSLTTVDRVLNNRKGVRQSTIDRVTEAMDRLNFVRDQAAATLARRRTYRFSFFVPTSDNSFIARVRDEIDRAGHSALRDRIEIRLILVPPFDANALVRAVEAEGAEIGDGVALVATESQTVRDLIAKLRQNGTHVVTLISDLPNSEREHFVGIDNVAAGRVAASLIKRFTGGQSGDVAVVAGSSTLRDHVERRLGFEQVIRSECADLNVLPWIEGADNAAIVEEKLTELLASSNNIAAVYSLGGGSRGVIAALSQCGRRIPAITHELTDYTRAALISGELDAVLAQDPSHEIRSAIRVLRAFCDDQDINLPQERIRIEIFMRDNLP